MVRLLGQFRKEIRYILLYGVVVGLINLSLPLGVQAIIGLIAGGAISASWGVMVFFILLGAVFTGVLRLMQYAVMEYMQRRIFTDFEVEFAARLPRLDLDRLRARHLPEVVNRFFDTLTLQKGLPKVIIDGSTAVLQIFFSLLLLSFYHSSLFTLSLLMLALLGVLFYWTVPMGLASSLLESKYKYKLAFWLEEVARLAPSFKMAGENRFSLTRADDHTVDYLDARARHWRILMLQMSSSVVFRTLVMGAFLILGSVLVMNNQLNIGQFVAAEILILFIVESVDKIILLHETGYDLLTATEKLGQVTDMPLEREGGIKVDAICQSGPLEVEFRDFSYTFYDGDTPVLHQLHLRVAPGERVAVAGYHGSGKSTLLEVLAALKTDYQGGLLFNGMPQKSLDLRSLRENIGYFSSRDDIFIGSLLENITLNNPYMSLPHVLQVVEQVGLFPFLQTLPEGIQTPLYPGGKTLPRSVVMKILMARAIVREPKLMIIEDLLGNFNYLDRLHLTRVLTDRAHGWTLVAVTEDPLLASRCDRVVVLQDGQVVFSGTFTELQATPHFQQVFHSDHSFTLNAPST